MQWIFAITLILIAVEYGFARRRGLNIYSRGELTITALIFAANYLASIYASEIGRYVPFSPAQVYNFVCTYLRIPAVYGFKWPGPEWLRLIFLFLLIDFMYYSSHWLAHRAGFFWAGHFSHHTITKFNIANAHRDPVRIMKIGPTLVWAPVAAQFPPTVALEVYTLFFWISVYSIWMHCSFFPRIQWLEWVFNTPSSHRMHHSLTNQDRTMAVNYGGVLIIWDRLFGTYLPEKENQHVFGVSGFQQSDRLWPVLFHQWIKLFKDLFKKVSFVKQWIGKSILHLRPARAEIASK